MSIAPGAVEVGWQPKAIIFDLLTALMDSWNLWDSSLPPAMSTEGRRWRECYLKITFGTGSYVPYENLVRESAHEAGLPPSAPEALLRDWEGLQAWPETGRVLRALRERGYKLGVVTNCSKDLGHSAARGVERSTTEGSAKDFIFDAVVTAEESRFYKPAKPAYEAILNLLGVDPSDALFVAGSAGDVQGATDAGMKVVWHNRIGLTKVGEADPLREGKMLNDTLKDFF
ncbi:HAD-like protein [Annulohypoxylon bovei var. microspora]|nr:HAD-like protein [Annulohypoxylon bovei var. microspora]